VLGIVAGAAVGVRAAGALLRPPWHDEYFTAWAAALPLGDLIAALRLDSGPPLPYLLAKLVAALGPSPLAAARLVSVLAGTLAVLVAARAAGRVAGAAAGAWCAALLALHPLAVAWSSEGRGYALLLLAAALAWERLEALRETGRGALGLALAVALGCWSHALGLVLAGATAVASLTLPRRGRQAALLGVGMGLASHLPWLPVAIAQPASATAWMAGAWLEMAPLERVLAPVRLLPPVAPFAAHLDLPSAPALAQALAAALCIWLLIAVGRAQRAGASSPLPAAVLTAVPAIGLGVLAWAGAPYLFPGRSEALYLAPFVGLLAAGAARSRAHRIGGVLLVAGAAASTGVALVAWGEAPPSDESLVAAAIRQHLQDGGTVVIGGYWRLGVSFHLGREAGRYELVNVPASAAAHPGWYEDARDHGATLEVDELAARLTTPAVAGRRVAIIVTPGTVTAPQLTALARRLELRQVLRLRAAVLWAAPAEGEQ